MNTIKVQNNLDPDQARRYARGQVAAEGHKFSIQICL